MPRNDATPLQFYNMDFSEYFEAVNINEGDLNYAYKDNQFLSAIELFNGQEVSDFDIAIIGVGEERNSTNDGCAQAPNHVRQ